MSQPLSPHPDVIWRDEPERRDEIAAALERGEDAGQEGWVVVVDGGIIHELNLLAGDIWMLCDGVRDEEAIAEVLADRYDAPRDEILADVRDFAQACVKRGWLVRKGG